MEKDTFNLIDNNSFTKNGKLEEILKELCKKSTKMNICSAFFYNFYNKSTNLDLFSYIIQQGLKLEINLILSERIGNMKKILSAFISNDLSLIEKEKDQDFVNNLIALNPIIFVLTKDQDQKHRFFHPKLYLFFQNDDCHTAILGSGNFTSAGMDSNIELNILETETSRVNMLNEWMNKIFSIASPLTLSLLDQIQDEPQDLLDNFKFKRKIAKPEKIEIKNEISYTFPNRIVQLNPEMEDQFIFEYFDLENNRIKVKSIEYYDLEYGNPQEIKNDEIISWALVKKDETKVSPLIISLCKKSSDTLQLLNSWRKDPQFSWVLGVINNYNNINENEIIEKESFQENEDIYLQVVVVNGDLIEGLIKTN